MLCFQAGLICDRRVERVAVFVEGADVNTRYICVHLTVRGPAIVSLLCFSTPVCRAHWVQAEHKTTPASRNEDIDRGRVQAIDEKVHTRSIKTVARRAVVCGGASTVSSPPASFRVLLVTAA